MWEFALLALGSVPLMGFATSIEMKKHLGEDESSLDAAISLSTPGGVIIETLLNMKTVSALTMESQRYHDYEIAMLASEPNHKKDAFMSGVTGGLSMFIQQWINVRTSITILRRIIY
jgi:ATP-binding cassette, subfamily B (MDR/TAP), member 1